MIKREWKRKKESKIKKEKKKIEGRTKIKKKNAYKKLIKAKTKEFFPFSNFPFSIHLYLIFSCLHFLKQLCND